MVLCKLSFQIIPVILFICVEVDIEKNSIFINQSIQNSRCVLFRTLENEKSQRKNLQKPNQVPKS